MGGARARCHGCELRVSVVSHRSMAALAPGEPSSPSRPALEASSKLLAGGGSVFASDDGACQQALSRDAALPAPACCAPVRPDYGRGDWAKIRSPHVCQRSLCTLRAHTSSALPAAAPIAITGMAGLVSADRRPARLVISSSPSRYLCHCEGAILCNLTAEVGGR